MRHIFSDDEYDTVQKQAASFLENEGRTLQRYTWLYSFFTDNYVTGFWQKYAYLHGRYPLLINSSVAHVDLLRDKDSTRAHRAARVVWIECMSHLAVDRQQYKAVRSVYEQFLNFYFSTLSLVIILYPFKDISEASC